MKEGDTVRWQSQAQGYQRVKEGQIVAVIPEGRRPSDAVFPALYKGSGVGMARNHESYVVKAHTLGRGGKPEGSSRLYWPRANALTLVTP